MNLLAHIRKNENEQWVIHPLKVHLESVAKIAEHNADFFGLSKIAKILGLVHDLGKTSKAFQNKIAGQSGFAPDVHFDPSVDHSTAGAQFLVEKYGKEIGTLLAYIIAGHHGGLPNGIDETNSCLRKRLSKSVEAYKNILPKSNFLTIKKNDFIPGKHTGNMPLQLPFLIRMLFSCLVDADCLDTEQFMSPEKSEHRSTERNSIPKLQKKLNEYISGFKTNTPLNKKRADILKYCRNAAKAETRLFSLTAPTGSGKTISSMAFALDHSIKHNLRRVIYVVPYTNIISQNAKVFQSIFGDENVLEHHSNLDPEKETVLNRLSSQNWDTPIVVTTNVQFFESFFSNKSSSCRKLHNIAESVIIFDEVQMFPAEYLKPSISVIRELVKSYGCSVVLCTATQPTLSDVRLLKRDALKNVLEIIPDPKTLYNEFKRVEIFLLNGTLTHIDIASKMADLDQVLTIVNTRKEARKIIESLSEISTDTNELFHLSTMMCSEHRNNVLSTVFDRLNANLPCRVVSTQLIEAGVDIDFPVVYRAIAGIDSIAQAAGRCNRNWKKEYGEVFVFKGETKPPVGHLRQAAESGEKVLNKHKDDPLSLRAISEYFEDFYWKQCLGHQMDKKNIMPLLRSKPNQIPFKDISKSFNLIEEETQAIIVPYGNSGERLIEDLRRWADKEKYMKIEKIFLPREMQRKAQRFSVHLRKKPFEDLQQARVVEDLFNDGQYQILVNRDIYDDNIGLTPDTPEFMKIESSIF